MSTEQQCRKRCAHVDVAPRPQVSVAARTQAAHARRSEAGEVDRADVPTSGNGALPDEASTQRQQRDSGKPLVDPPEFGDRIRDTDKEPYWIPGAFPTIFQNETGDPYNYIHKEPDLVTWGPHVLRSRGWWAQTHMTFMYWWMNLLQRI